MEFLMLTTLAVVIFMLWRYPQKEKIAFALLVAVACLDCFLYFVSKWDLFFFPVNL